MNKQTLSQIQTATENAVSALERLEQALDANDWRKIGAALYTLRRELEKIQTLTEE